MNLLSRYSDFGFHSWMPTHASTVCSPAKETLVERMVLGWNQVRAKQAKDTEYAIKTIERKNMDRFRVLNFFLNQRHISFEHFCKKVADAFPEVRIQIRHDKDIEKISWLYELDDLCQNYKDADPTLQFPELKRLQRFFKIDLQEIPFIKAKVCLYVMSVPAYQILKCEIQKALMATLKILFLPESLLKEWLSIRHLPMLVTD
ncbi:uncharacterized protein LOC106869994 [Octopus bimaculoides]|nr:uncharacterized protein LOC106869994 [Octopus bimaculoides]|eukprot:XP_014771437.1 PREDICTED: uncharacterized protein LOC106869994 [Octopus bimaculoides]